MFFFIKIKNPRKCNIQKYGYKVIVQRASNSGPTTVRAKRDHDCAIFSFCNVFLIKIKNPHKCNIQKYVYKVLLHIVNLRALTSYGDIFVAKFLGFTKHFQQQKQLAVYNIYSNYLCFATHLLNSSTP